MVVAAMMATVSVIAQEEYDNEIAVAYGGGSNTDLVSSLGKGMFTGKQLDYWGPVSVEYLLTDNQQALMKAIAKDGCVASPQSDEFIKRYNLPSASSVKTALDVLIDKDLVYRTPKGYIVYDHFLAIWLTRQS